MRFATRFAFAVTVALLLCSTAYAFVSVDFVRPEKFRNPDFRRFQRAQSPDRRVSRLFRDACGPLLEEGAGASDQRPRCHARRSVRTLAALFGRRAHPSRFNPAEDLPMTNEVAVMRASVM